MSRGISRNCCVTIIALAFIWTFVGALINFHQHQIFGKELIEKAYPHIKPKTKDKLTFDGTFEVEKELICFNVSDQEIKAETINLVLTSYSTHRLFHKMKIPDQEFDQRLLFRGPPSIS